MKKPWIIIDSARPEVDLAADDYEGKLPGLGDRFLRAVRSQLESISL